MRKIYFLMAALLATFAVSAQSPTTIDAEDLVYSIDFEDGEGDCDIVGDGEIVACDSVGFGQVFHNNADDDQTRRSHYLLLPDDLFTDLYDAASVSRAFSIGFWVNLADESAYVADGAGGYYSVLFAAYGAEPAEAEDGSLSNTGPMMVLESRYWVQINDWAGNWCDFGDNLNVAGSNNVPSTDDGLTWLEDGAWHYYTFTINESTAVVYIDGVIVDQWSYDNTTDGQVMSGLFDNLASYIYPCLGGNQAWSWDDPDNSFMYDDFAVYSIALASTQIAGIIQAKRSNGISDVAAANEGTIVSVEYFNVAGAKVGTDYNKLVPGIYIQRAVYSNGLVKGTKVVKSNL